MRPYRTGRPLRLCRGRQVTDVNVESGARSVSRQRGNESSRSRIQCRLLQEVEKALLSCSSDAPAGARLGAVSSMHRFGSALNANLHFHCCVIDGVFSAVAEEIRFHSAFLTDAAILASLLPHALER